METRIFEFEVVFEPNPAQGGISIPDFESAVFVGELSGTDLDEDGLITFQAEEDTSSELETLSAELQITAGGETSIVEFELEDIFFDGQAEELLNEGMEFTFPSGVAGTFDFRVELDPPAAPDQPAVFESLFLNTFAENDEGEIEIFQISQLGLADTAAAGSGGTLDLQIATPDGTVTSSLIAGDPADPVFPDNQTFAEIVDAETLVFEFEVVFEPNPAQGGIDIPDFESAVFVGELSGADFDGDGLITFQAEEDIISELETFSAELQITAGGETSIVEFELEDIFFDGQAEELLNEGMEFTFPSGVAGTFDFRVELDPPAAPDQPAVFESLFLNTFAENDEGEIEIFQISQLGLADTAAAGSGGTLDLQIATPDGTVTSTFIAGDPADPVFPDNQTFVAIVDDDVFPRVGGTVFGTPEDDVFANDPTSESDFGIFGFDNQVFGGAGADTVELVPVPASPLPEGVDEEPPGDNIIVTGSGTDAVTIAGSGNIVFGGEGADTLVALESTGGNRLSGGAGDDILVLSPADGLNDRFLGDTGNDTFITFGGSGNILSGGAGADDFVIFNGGDPAANTIVDFESGTDTLTIAGDAFSFGDIDLSQGNSVLLAGTEVATLTVAASTLVEADFVFLADPVVV